MRNSRILRDRAHVQWQESIGIQGRELHGRRLLVLVYLRNTETYWFRVTILIMVKFGHWYQIRLVISLVLG